MAVLERQQQFDFQKNGIEVMNFETLQRTYKENDIYNNPVQGIYHYQVIRRMMDICEKHSLNYEVEEIFAAQNRNKTQPGVSILPQVEQTHGEKAVEAHILRRIFATIRIKDWETDELTTTLVVAYHQDGIQAAIGPCVLICHNQCILSPERSVCNYGKKKVSTEEVFETVDGWLANFEVNMNEDIERIRRLKNKIISMEEVYMYIGLLTALRVSHDSSDRNLSSSVETYPLNQGQISIFTEEVLKLAMTKGQITAWDLYNVATEIYKPGKTDFPALIPQTSHSFLSDVLRNNPPISNRNIHSCHQIRGAAAVKSAYQSVCRHGSMHQPRAVYYPDAHCYQCHRESAANCLSAV